MKAKRAQHRPPDAQRFSKLWELYASRIQAYAMRHVDPDTAQEVVSETFLVAWRRLADVPGEPLPWLLVVARNTISNQRRSTYRARVVHNELTRITRLADTMVAIDVLVTERDAILRALATLSAKEREAMLLVTWDGLTPTQAATVAGCTTSAFKVRLHRARRHLNEAITATEHEPRLAPLTPSVVADSKGRS